MKKYVLLVLGFLMVTVYAQAEENSPETTTTAASSAAPVAVETTEASVSSSATPTTAETSSSAPKASTEEVSPAPAAENLEFISGEISAVDTAAKSVTVKLYGETENNPNDKILTVKVEDTTDITDGEKDRELASLTTGTEVDVEYDPATKKATYIFVY